ncbi:MAG: hypothetical protein LBH72_04275 [Proteiniphilum sp.]|jgi:hypothetical protein|nr:hypothetical protein [Proteiniphilum sp.]
MKLSPSHIPFRRLPALLLLCVAYAALQAAALRPAVAIPFPLLLLKSAIDSLTLAGTGALLSMIITSSGYVKLRPLQRYINLLALGLAALPVWTALFSLTLRLVSGSTGFAGSLPLLPLATLLGILLYVILLQATLHRTADREGRREEE